LVADAGAGAGDDEGKGDLQAANAIAAMVSAVMRRMTTLCFEIRLIMNTLTPYIQPQAE
jgi:hypothetical protein